MKNTTSYYYDLSESPVINACGNMTKLGVSRINETVMNAMKYGGENFFRVSELKQEIENRISIDLGVDSCYITSSASSGIAQAVAGVIFKNKTLYVDISIPEKIQKREILLLKGHSVDYGAPIVSMIRMGGGIPVEAGSINLSKASDVEMLINENTAALLYVVSHHTSTKGMISLEEMIAIGQTWELPVIVDAAAEYDLMKYYNAGSSLVIYSGSKAIGGPTSGLVLGRYPFIGTVKSQANGLGRAMKIGKENIVGFYQAIRTYNSTFQHNFNMQENKLQSLLENLNQITGINSYIVADEVRPDLKRIRIDLREDIGIAYSLNKFLLNNKPSIYCRDYLLHLGILDFDLRNVSNSEIEVISESVMSFMKGDCDARS